MHSPNSIDVYSHHNVSTTTINGVPTNNDNDHNNEMDHPLMNWAHVKTEEQHCYPPTLFHAPLPPPPSLSGNSAYYHHSNSTSSNSSISGTSFQGNTYYDDIIPSHDSNNNVHYSPPSTIYDPMIQQQQQQQNHHRLSIYSVASVLSATSGEDSYYTAYDDTQSLTSINHNNSNKLPYLSNASPSSSLASSPFSPDCSLQQQPPPVDYYFRPPSSTDGLMIRRSSDYDSSMPYDGGSNSTSPCTCSPTITTAALDYGGNTATSNDAYHQHETFYLQQPISPITPTNVISATESFSATMNLTTTMATVAPVSTTMTTTNKSATCASKKNSEISPSPSPSPTTAATKTTKSKSTIINGDIRPYACCMCTRAFARKHDLQRHVRVHTGDKPYVCLCCKKAFARTDALKRHLRMEEACRLSPEVQAMKCAGKRRYRNL